MALVLCQRNSYLTNFVAKVISSKVSAVAGSTTPLYDVVLSDTVLFPTGGGQPCDFGTIGGSKVIGVERTPEGVVHRVEGPVNEGTEVEVQVDWDRRFDHMQQHSSQHLISAIAEDKFSAPTTGWGLLSKNCVIDFSGNFDTDSLAALELQVNEKIRDARAVMVQELAPSDLASMGHLRSRGLPEGLETARVIKIDGVDMNPCCGTHVKNTAELQLIKFVGLEKKKGGVRVTFLAGQRAIAQLGTYVLREQAMNKLFGCGGDSHVDAVVRLMDQHKSALSETKSLQKELAEALGARLAASRMFAVLHREGANMDFLRTIARATHVINPDVLLFLTCGEEKGESQFLLTGPEGKVAKCSAEITKLLNAKGGGKGSSFQGKTTTLAGNLDKVLPLSSRYHTSKTMDQN